MENFERIDVELFVNSLENTINELNKNPPEIIKQEVIDKMLKEALNNAFCNLFMRKVDKDVKALFANTLNQKYVKLVNEIANDVIKSERFKKSLKARISKRMVDGL